MKTFQKIAYGVVASVAIAAPASASPSLLVALPDISVLTAEAGRWIAEEFLSLQKLVLSVPRVERTSRAPSVTIFEGTNHMIVVASRLRSTDANSAVQP